jgi:hypothetical protein
MFPMTRTTTAPQRGVLAPFALLLISMLSAQALAQTFDFDGITYHVNPFTIATDVEARGRASSNTTRDIVIPATVVNSGTRYSVTSVRTLAHFDDAVGSGIGRVGLQDFRANGLTSESFPEFMALIERGALRSDFITSVTFPDNMTLIENAAFFDNSVLTSAAFLRDFRIFSLPMFTVTPKLASITYAQVTAGWDDVTFTPSTAPTGSVTAEAAAPQATATPVTVSPLRPLGIRAILLSLVAVRKPPF